MTTNPLDTLDEPRSFYARFDQPFEEVTAALTVAPPHVVHLVKEDDDDDVRIITPLGWLDEAEAGCMTAVFWYPGTVVHFYVDTSSEVDMTAAVERIDGEHLGS